MPDATTTTKTNTSPMPTPSCPFCGAPQKDSWSMHDSACFISILPIWVLERATHVTPSITDEDLERAWRTRVPPSNGLVFEPQGPRMAPGEKNAMYLSWLSWLGGEDGPDLAPDRELFCVGWKAGMYWERGNHGPA